MADQRSNVAVPWVRDIPDHIKPKYSRFVLIDGEITASELAMDDGDTLFITTDWAAWCGSINEKRHCLHYEAGLANWTERNAPVTDFVDQVVDSIYPQTGDPTLFMGASVLDSLQSFTINIGRIFLRLDAALSLLIDSFEPSEIILSKMKFEMRDLSPDCLAKAVEIISHQRGCSYTNISDTNEVESQKASHETTSFYAFLISFGRKVIIDVYVQCISLISKLRKETSTPKSNVLVQPTGAMIIPLLESYRSKNITPVLLARQVPKSLTLVLLCIWKGLLLVESPDPRRTSQSVKSANIIINKLKTAWASEEGLSSLSNFMRYYVDEHLIQGGEFHATVEQIIAYDAFIKIHKIQRIVCSGFLNPQAMIFLQLAREKNIPADDILHGLRVNHMQYPQLRRGNSHSPLVPRLLAWGQQNADWIKDLQSETDVAFVGYPGIQSARTQPKSLSIKLRKALVLPFEPDRDNIIGLHSHSFAALAEVIRVLVTDNYDVTVKVHPGIKKNVFDTYVTLTTLFHLNCQVIQKGNLIHMAETADIVVGPMNSSAMIQVVSIGKPYYPCAIPPTVDQPSYILNHQPSTCGHEFANAISQSQHLNNEKILAYFCCTNSPEDALSRFWQAMDIDNTKPLTSSKTSSLTSS
ncbi:hypothetical protein N8000_09425 [Rhodospirillales bacterium]|nr:hypothetical protein [Rhodospirillales bacterium]